MTPSTDATSCNITTLCYNNIGMQDVEASNITYGGDIVQENCCISGNANATTDAASAACLDPNDAENYCTNGEFSTAEPLEYKECQDTACGSECADCGNHMASCCSDPSLLGEIETCDMRSKSTCTDRILNCTQFSSKALPYYANYSSMASSDFIKSTTQAAVNGSALSSYEDENLATRVSASESNLNAMPNMSGETPLQQKNAIFALYGAPFSPKGAGISSGVLLDSETGGICAQPRSKFSETSSNINAENYCNSYNTSSSTLSQCDNNVYCESNEGTCAPASDCPFASNETLKLCTATDLLCSAAETTMADTLREYNSGEGGQVVDPNVTHECWYPTNVGAQKVMVAGSYLDKDKASSDKFMSCEVPGEVCSSPSNVQGLCGTVWYGQGKGAVDFDTPCNPYSNDKPSSSTLECNEECACASNEDIFKKWTTLGCSGFLM